MALNKKHLYKYTADCGTVYALPMLDYIAEAAGLEPHPNDTRPLYRGAGFEPRHVWCKETNPQTVGRTKRTSLVVEADSPLYKTRGWKIVVINDVEFVTTGRVGETMTFGVGSTLTFDKETAEDGTPSE